MSSTALQLHSLFGRQWPAVLHLLLADISVAWSGGLATSVELMQISVDTGNRQRTVSHRKSTSLGWRNGLKRAYCSSGTQLTRCPQWAASVSIWPSKTPLRLLTDSPPRCWKIGHDQRLSCRATPSGAGDSQDSAHAKAYSWAALFGRQRARKTVCASLVLALARPPSKPNSSSFCGPPDWARLSARAY
ncbi:hypothetical protein Q31a_34290 [Aureliella helgolandensis]|uniref:Uncharacterized protein n=1 Tax=Aureliella helgolandensis TaxID=2527968 RepID=A0A518G944_9BACT|nr:hypothetical protein Q31a_34290 [Aureliella helgolandensis]